ncbi:MAG: hypothetical protein E7Z91_01535 [Cyanobacteria bacterium SIG30]|nr:hypothetical protein [Cyanobacteria bacterium SIG30]
MGGIATTIYCLRNAGKVKNGEIGRAPVAVMQSANSASQAVSGAINSVDDLGRFAKIGEKVGKGAEKVSSFASKVTNPLLVGAAGLRVLKDDDKESAIIEETMAMTGMFASEAIYKRLQNTVVSNAGKKLKANAKVLSDGKIAKKLAGLGKKIGKMSSGKQKAIFILAELGLVATSIFAFDSFKKLGKKMTGRDKQKDITNNQNKTNVETPVVAKINDSYVINAETMNSIDKKALNGLLDKDNPFATNGK